MKAGDFVKLLKERQGFLIDELRSINMLLEFYEGDKMPDINKMIDLKRSTTNS